MPCCRNPQFSAGEWRFPNRSNIPTRENAAVFYRDREDDGSVSLNILSSENALPLLTGLFCCVVPDATDTIQTVCADISKFADFNMHELHSIIFSLPLCNNYLYLQSLHFLLKLVALESLLPVRAMSYTVM